MTEVTTNLRLQLKAVDIKMPLQQNINHFEYAQFQQLIIILKLLQKERETIDCQSYSPTSLERC